MNKKYMAEVEQAKANYSDLQERGAAAVGGDAIEFINSILTPEEKAESALHVALTD